VGCTLQKLLLLADAITYQYFLITSWLCDLGWTGVTHLNTYSRNFEGRASSTDPPINSNFSHNLAEEELRTIPNTGRCIKVLQYYDDMHLSEGDELAVSPIWVV